MVFFGKNKKCIFVAKLFLYEKDSMYMFCRFNVLLVS